MSLSACRRSLLVNISTWKWSRIPFELSLSKRARNLCLHEYQAKELMDRYQVPTQRGFVVSNLEEAREQAAVLQRQGMDTIVLKAQIFAGGRGKGMLSSGLKGGVQFAKTLSQVEEFVNQMLGHTLVTHQTGPQGMIVNKVLLTEAINIEKELYLSIVLDRGKGGPVIVASKEGGIDIEEVARNSAQAIHMESIDILTGPTEENLRSVANALIPEASQYSNARDLRNQIKGLLQTMYKMFVETDSSQIEINPLAITREGRVLCVDAKLSFDDNAQFRQKLLFDQEDTTLKDKREMEAEASHLNFVAMDGDIGCLVNGAGLAMATMDIIQHCGGQPANFLDLGGGATKEQVLKSFQLLTADPNVKAIFVNIFGGITRCDTVAQGILEAAQEIGLRCPMVVRLVGNKADQAQELLRSPALRKTGVNISYVQNFSQAAHEVVRLAQDVGPT